jgi:hypothetical protein
MSYQLSKKELVKEIIKSGKDPHYFINNYAKISHPLRGLIPFKTYDFQKDLLEDFNDYRFSVILKARQMGISTIIGAYISWMMLFHRDKNILVMATKYQTASNLVKKVKAIIKHLPEWIQIASISVDNRASFELTNGSQIKAASTSIDAGRSEALSLLVIDEAAHVDGLDDLWTGLYPTISTGGRCIVASTPNGVGNWFHQTYIDAEIQANDFHSVKLFWDLHPDRDQEWFEKETKNLSRRQIAQEFECNFNMSGETVIHPDDMNKIEAMVMEPEYRTGFDRGLWIWKDYDPSCVYLMSADVARGDGKDYSAFHIINLNTMEIVAEYQGKMAPDHFAPFLASNGSQYGDCMIVVENNNIGYTVLEKIKELEYKNVYHSVKSTHEYVEQYLAESRSNCVPGFTTSGKTRPMILAKLEEFIRNDIIKIHSSRLLNELKTFVWNNNKPEAMRGYNDDLVMALAIACWVRDTALTVNQRDVEYRKAFMNSIVKGGTTLNTAIPGMKNYEPTKMIEKRKEYEKYAWLYKG